MPEGTSHTVVFLPSIAPSSSREESRECARMLANKGHTCVLIEWPGFHQDPHINNRFRGIYRLQEDITCGIPEIESPSFARRLSKNTIVKFTANIAFNKAKTALKNNFHRIGNTAMLRQLINPRNREDQITAHKSGSRCLVNVAEVGALQPDVTTGTGLHLQNCIPPHAVGKQVVSLDGQILDEDVAKAAPTRPPDVPLSDEQKLPPSHPDFDELEDMPYTHIMRDFLRQFVRFLLLQRGGCPLSFVTHAQAGALLLRVFEDLDRLGSDVSEADEAVLSNALAASYHQPKEHIAESEERLQVLAKEWKFLHDEGSPNTKVATEKWLQGENITRKEAAFIVRDALVADLLRMHLHSVIFASPIWRSGTRGYFDAMNLKRLFTKQATALYIFSETCRFHEWMHGLGSYFAHQKMDHYRVYQYCIPRFERPITDYNVHRHRTAMLRGFPVSVLGAWLGGWMEPVRTAEHFEHLFQKFCVAPASPLFPSGPAVPPKETRAESFTIPNTMLLIGRSCTDEDFDDINIWSQHCRRLDVAWRKTRRNTAEVAQEKNRAPFSQQPTAASHTANPAAGRFGPLILDRRSPQRKLDVDKREAFDRSRLRQLANVSSSSSKILSSSEALTKTPSQTTLSARTAANDDEIERLKTIVVGPYRQRRWWQLGNRQFIDHMAMKVIERSQDGVTCRFNGVELPAVYGERDDWNYHMDHEGREFSRITYHPFNWFFKFLLAPFYPDPQPHRAEMLRKLAPSDPNGRPLAVPVKGALQCIEEFPKFCSECIDQFLHTKTVNYDQIEEYWIRNPLIYDDIERKPPTVSEYDIGGDSPDGQHQ